MSSSMAQVNLGPAYQGGGPHGLQVVGLRLLDCLGHILIFLSNKRPRVFTSVNNSEAQSIIIMCQSIVVMCICPPTPPPPMCERVGFLLTGARLLPTGVAACGKLFLFELCLKSGNICLL